MSTVVEPDLFADPFHERSGKLTRGPLQLLGAKFEFESNSEQLMQLVDLAYARLPRHRLPGVVPRLRVGLLLTSSQAAANKGRRSGSEPPPLQMFSGAGFVGGATGSSDFVMVSQVERTALVGVSANMLRSPYHTRYEVIEFAVFSLAARVQGLVPLHAACVGAGGRGLLLMGASGSGKSTVSLQCLLQGLDFVSEDAVFVTPDSLRATGVANFLHVRSDSLRWVSRKSDVAAIRNSPVITRRSGVKKFEVDLRRGGYRLAASPLQLASVVFLSAQSAGTGPLLIPLSRRELLARMTAAQAYAANQPQWPSFCRNVTRQGGFELRRGRHPLEAVEALRELLASGRR